MKYFLLYLLLINIFSFFVYGHDKKMAVQKKWRTPESTLLLFAFLGGNIGAFLGMQFFHHKTRHTKFVIGVPLAFLIWVVICIYLLFFVWRSF